MTPLFTADQLRQKHQVSSDVKVVTLRRTWSVWFNVNGNAPADAKMAAFATKELADQALTLFHAQKDDKCVILIVNGRAHMSLETCYVEGYDFDTWYEVREDWSNEADERIFTSLTDLTELCDEEDNADGALDGAFVADEDDEEDEEDF